MARRNASHGSLDGSALTLLHELRPRQIHVISFLRKSQHHKLLRLSLDALARGNLLVGLKVSHVHQVHTVRTGKREEKTEKKNNFS